MFVHGKRKLLEPVRISRRDYLRVIAIEVEIIIKIFVAVYKGRFAVFVAVRAPVAAENEITSFVFLKSENLTAVEGVPERKVIMKHAVKNALLPVIR